MFEFIISVKLFFKYLLLLYVFIEIHAHSAIKCPNKVPEDSPQPIVDLKELNNFPEEKAGISSKVNLPSASPLLNVQVQAALALVPCGQEVVSVFTPSTLRKDHFNPNDKFSVAVVYTDELSTNEIKLWALKHYQSTSNNPIKEAVFKSYDIVPTKLGSDEVFDVFCSDEEDFTSVPGTTNTEISAISVDNSTLQPTATLFPTSTTEKTTKPLLTSITDLKKMSVISSTLSPTKSSIKYLAKEEMAQSIGTSSIRPTTISTTTSISTKPTETLKTPISLSTTTSIKRSIYTSSINSTKLSSDISTARLVVVLDATSSISSKEILISESTTKPNTSSVGPSTKFAISETESTTTTMSTSTTGSNTTSIDTSTKGSTTISVAILSKRPTTTVIYTSTKKSEPTSSVHSAPNLTAMATKNTTSGLTKRSATYFDFYKVWRSPNSYTRRQKHEPRKILNPNCYDTLVFGRCLLRSIIKTLSPQPGHQLITHPKNPSNDLSQNFGDFEKPNQNNEFSPSPQFHYFNLTLNNNKSSQSKASANATNDYFKPLFTHYNTSGHSFLSSKFWGSKEANYKQPESASDNSSESSTVKTKKSHEVQPTKSQNDTSPNADKYPEKELIQIPKELDLDSALLSLFELFIKSDVEIIDEQKFHTNFIEDLDGTSSPAPLSSVVTESIELTTDNPPFKLLEELQDKQELGKTTISSGANVTSSITLLPSFSPISSISQTEHQTNISSERSNNQEPDETTTFIKYNDTSSVEYSSVITNSSNSSKKYQQDTLPDEINNENPQLLSPLSDNFASVFSTSETSLTNHIIHNSTSSITPRKNKLPAESSFVNPVTKYPDYKEKYETDNSTDEDKSEDAKLDSFANSEPNSTRVLKLVKEDTDSKLGNIMATIFHLVNTLLENGIEDKDQKPTLPFEVFTTNSSNSSTVTPVSNISSSITNNTKGLDSNESKIEELGPGTLSFQTFKKKPTFILAPHNPITLSPNSSISGGFAPDQDEGQKFFQSKTSSEDFISISQRPSSVTSQQPNIRFKVRIRTRKDFSCCKEEEKVGGRCITMSESCKTLINEEKFVSCHNITKLSSFSKGRPSEALSWLACEEEDNEYLKQIDFYKVCSSSFKEKDKLFEKIRVNKNKQLSRETSIRYRNGEKRKPRVYPGPETTPRENKEDLVTEIRRHTVNKSNNQGVNSDEQHLYPETSYFSSIIPNPPTYVQPIEVGFIHYLSNILYRQRRNTQSISTPPRDSGAIRVRESKSHGDPLPNKLIFVSKIKSCRVLKYRNGYAWKRCDKIMETDALEYNTAIALFPRNMDLTTDLN